MSVRNAVAAQVGIDRREAILAAIRAYVARTGYPPNIREIGHAVGLASTSTVHSHLQRLEAEGRLQITPGCSRALRVMEVPR